MRPVRANRLPKLHDTASLDAAKSALAAIADPEERAQFITKNAGLCSAFRHGMWALNGCKCWYSEAIIQADQGHVEHYRPKSKVAGEAHSGYWWRAFDWTNFRLAHPTVNFRVTDYLTGKLAGKGTYFPLRSGCARATCFAEEAAEAPILLDPTQGTDCRLLCFELTSGKPIPRFDVAADPWLNQRAAESIWFYHLDEGTWNTQRKDLIDDVQKLCEQIEAQAAGRPATILEYEASVAELMEYLDHMAEFSSVALQVVRERGLLEHLHPMPGE